MKKFLAIYNAPAANMEAFAALTPEQKMEGMKPWMEWEAKFGSSIVNMGAPLFPANVSDASGNWSAGNSEVGGFSIVEAADAEAAKAIFEGHPHLSSGEGVSVAIHEFAPMG